MAVTYVIALTSGRLRVGPSAEAKPAGGMLHLLNSEQMLTISLYRRNLSENNTSFLEKVRGLLVEAATLAFKMFSSSF